jgi:NAD(P)-dependent dehydrogenase (short-subunit alcohol dehydrogenase family)
MQQREASPTSQRLCGTIALVTGARQGIGRAIVERFVAEGASVLATDLLAENELPGPLPDLGPDGCYRRLDVTREEDWRSTRAWLEQRRGRLDVLVNNAGIDWICPLSELTLADWRRVMAVNAEGPFIGTREMTGLLATGGRQRAGGASVINISTVVGMVACPDTAAYNASKGALRMFGKTCALEFAGAGLPIRVNTIFPGYIADTAIFDDGLARIAAMLNASGRGPVTVADLIRAGIALHPLGRVGKPDDIAGPAAFLASADSAFMTGSDLVVDGGFTAR